MAEKENKVGQVTGLAWTEVGGDFLTIEGADMPGKGVGLRTGSIGDARKDPVEAARTVVRARVQKWWIPKMAFETRHLHVHFPDGAIPKGGTSAGIVISTALVSAVIGVRVRGAVAMTGEMILRGEVLAFGGLQE